MTLTQIRESLRLKQIHVARRSGRSQSWVSRTERSGDPLLSALARYITALGCNLILEVRHHDRCVTRFEWRPEDYEGEK